MKDAMLCAEALDRTGFAFDEEGTALWLVDQSGRKACSMAGESVQDKAESRVPVYRFAIEHKTVHGGKVGRLELPEKRALSSGPNLLPAGAEVEPSVAPSDRPAERMKGVGTVAWVCL
jgi:hypothetical protein